MFEDIFQVGLIVSILATAVRMGTILLLGAVGELVAERSGVLNLSVEGMMLTGAFAGFLGAFYTESLWFGVFTAALGGIVISAVFGLLAVIFQIDQTVSGLSVNIFSGGLTFYLYRTLFPDVGGQNIPSLAPFSVVHIPYLSDIPIIGRIFFQQYALTYIAFFMLLIVAFYLYRTKSGLILRTLGENPRAVDMKGINVTLYRFAAVLFGGMMAGLAGAFITLASVGIFVADITAGRGWLAIAIVIFGDWKPSRILWASLFFGLIDAGQMQIQALGVDLPFQLFLAMPYLLTIVAVFLGRKKSGAPIALGVHYVRE